MSMKAINTEGAPAAIGPYVQAIDAGDFIFVSGQIPFDPKTMQVVSSHVKDQTQQSLNNIKAIIEAAGCQIKDIVRCGIFLKSMDDFASVNEVYAKFFGSHKPARSCVEVARLPRDVLVEIEAIAYKNNK